jgi:hypothetical protein
MPTILIINKFSETRRMKFNKHLIQKMSDPLRETVGLFAGNE